MTTPKLSDQLKREGLQPTRWSNQAHFVYAAHDHPYGKVLVVEQGSITFTLKGGAQVVAMIPPPAPGSKAGRTWAGTHFRTVPVRHTGLPAGQEQVVGMTAGDRLDLPARTPHSAVVGPDGVVCLEAHRPSA